MRGEEEMMHLILDTARGDERVRAVCMNGSRANPGAPKDILMDFDIVYLVTELQSYLAEPDWIDVFGERVILQRPDDSALFPAEREDSYAYLMQFQDGNRIDLTLRLLTSLPDYLGEDSQTVVLLDKDGRIPALPPPSDRCYHIARPTQAQFAACCNEFWWVSPYVGKGIWRRELPYAQDQFNRYVRLELTRMLSWLCAMEHDFSISTGKSGKYLERYLGPEDWCDYAATYAGGDYEELWRALEKSGELFGSAARRVAEGLGLLYDASEGERVRGYLRRLRALPPGAADFPAG